MTIQTNLHSAGATARDSATVMFLGGANEPGVDAPAFENFMPPVLTTQSSTQSTTQSESCLGENMPVFHERLTQVRPTRWWGIND